MTFESVVLPAPFSPSRACTSPAAASKSTPSFATTPGKRFVIPRSLTAGGVLACSGIHRRTGRARARPVRGWLALGAPEHALDEPVHRVELLHAQLLAFLEAELALLVVERAFELVELPADEAALLGCDQPLRLRGHLRAIRREGDQAILDAPVVEAGFPGVVHDGLDALQVVRAPVVDGRRQPRVRRELLGVRVVPDPRDLLRLGVLPRRRAVDVLPEHVGAGGVQILGRLALLVGREPAVRPDELDLDAGMRGLRAEREGV